MTNVAVLVLAAREPCILALAIKAYKQANFDVFVHIDSKIDKSDYVAKVGPIANSVKFVEPREKVYWGGFSMVNATLNLIYNAMQSSNYDYFILVSDDTLSVRRPDELANIAVTKSDRISIRKLDNNEQKMRRYREFFCVDHQVSQLQRGPIEENAVDGKFLEYLDRMRRRIEVGKYDLDIFSGHQWWALSDRTIEIILEFNQKSEIRESFEFSAVPDEMYFHSIIGNYIESNNRMRTPVYTDWTRHIKPWKFSDIKDIPENFSDEIYFARKFTSSHLEIAEAVTCRYDY